MKDFVMQSLRIFTQLILLYLILLTIQWNLGNIGFDNYAPAESSKWMMLITRLDQSWNMFSPSPPHSSWWYVIEAELVNSKKIELFTKGGIHTWIPNEVISYDQPPEDFVDCFRNHRWYKFFENGYNDPANEFIRLSFGRYICREYNSRRQGGEQIFQFDVHWISHTVDLNGTKSIDQREVLWQHICFDTRPEY